MLELTFDVPLGVFSDVHGNLPALEAVLDDMRRQGARPVCLGDLVGYGPFPNEVVELVAHLNVPCLMGNYDQGIGFEIGDCGCVYRTDEQRAEGAASLAWTQAAASEATKAVLRGLHGRFELPTAGGPVLAVHGSPRRINEYLFEDRPASAMQRLATSTLDAEGLPFRGIVFGHTHLPYARDIDTGLPARPVTTFVNVGSAGRPKDGDWRACYALLTPPASIGNGLRAEFVRVPYDHDRLMRALAATSLTTTFDGSPPARGLAKSGPAARQEIPSQEGGHR